MVKEVTKYFRTKLFFISEKYCSYSFVTLSGYDTVIGQGRVALATRGIGRRPVSYCCQTIQNYIILQRLCDHSQGY